MVSISKISQTDISKCAEIYQSAYGQEPWNEKYSLDDLSTYIADYLGSNTKCAYSLLAEGNIVGIALGLIIPCVGSQYFRLEDICIDPKYQKMGYGKKFLELLYSCLISQKCDSILLGTQRGYPSHKFYLQNGFSEVDSVLLYRELLATELLSN